MYKATYEPLTEKPEVLIGLNLGEHFIDFSLAEKARVAVMLGSPPFSEHQCMITGNGTASEIEEGKWSIEWGRLQVILQALDLVKKDFEVEVVDNLWNFHDNPRKVTEHIDELSGKLSRRNRQIRDLKVKLTTLEEKLRKKSAEA